MSDRLTLIDKEWEALRRYVSTDSEACRTMPVA